MDAIIHDLTAAHRPASSAALSILAAALTILGVWVSPAEAQVTGIARDTLLSVGPGDSVLILPDEFLLPGTVVLTLDSTELRRDLDYTVDIRNGSLRLSAGIITDIVSSGGGLAVRIRVRYRYLPFRFRPLYRKREARPMDDSLAAGTDTLYAPAGDFSLDDFFGSGLRKSGSLLRGIQVGSNRDLTLSSGFRLQMSGPLSDEIDILAALTDENSPIQPEGTTQTLQELDRVFIELRGRKGSATMGDITVDFGEGEFGRLTRKLRGALGSYRFGGETDSVMVDAAGAAVRGKFSTNRFMGIQGVQGPYRLRGRENEYPIIVIAGTERVYLDGRELTRGQLNDYIIDYSLGELTFTTGVRITFASRITVEFEYTDRSYARNLVGARGRVALGPGGWRFGAMVVQENDDRDALSDLTLSESDREVLRGAGDSRLNASRSGIVYAGPGKGAYLMLDTTVYFPVPGTLLDTTILVYAPSDTLHAVYNATFSYTGPGGDYDRVAVGYYRYAGPGRGSYSPVRFLPLPERHSLATFGAGGEIAGGLSLGAGYAASEFDGNTFSSLGDADNRGGAYDLTLRYDRRDARLAGIGIPSLALRARQRGVDAGFIPMERYNEVEYERDWNITTAGPAPERLRDLEISVGPAESVSLRGAGAWLWRGDGFSSGRYSGSLLVERHLDYSFGHLSGTGDIPGRRSRRTTHAAKGSVPLGKFVPELSFRREHQVDRDTSSASAGTGSYAFTDIAPGFSLDSLWGMRFSARVGMRLDDSVRGTDLARASESFYQAYGWTYNRGAAITSTLDLRLERREFFHDTLSRSAESTVLVRSLLKIAPFGKGLQTDFYYEASPERAARFDRYFTRVARGTGNYVYAGDVNGNGVADEEDYRQTRFDGDYVLSVLPGDEFFPVVNLKASVRIRTELSRFFAPDEGGIGGLLSPLSSETYVRIEEKSSDPRTRNIYLLRPGTFRNPGTTLQGTELFSQDVMLFENNPGFSMRGRYLQRKSLNSLSLSQEAAYIRERGVRLNWSLAGTLSSQAEYLERIDEVNAGDGAYRNHAVSGSSLALDWTYRPATDIESGFGFTVEEAKNYEYSTASVNVQRIHVAYSVVRTGRLRVEFLREEAVIRGSPGNIPFELTRGRIAGKTWIWRLDFEYRLTQYLESSLRYEGRKEGAFPAVHNGSVEVRAFF